MIDIGMLEKLVIKVCNKQKYDKAGFFHHYKLRNLTILHMESDILVKFNLTGITQLNCSVV